MRKALWLSTLGFVVAVSSLAHAQDPCAYVTCTAPPTDCYASPGTCSSGTCSYTPLPGGTQCTDGNVCTSGDTCNGAGVCQSGTLVNSDDANPCTIDACDPIAGVTHTPVANGSSCSDGNACNGNETCQNGVCTAGTAVACSQPPGNCYEALGTCSPGSGACSYTFKPAGASCDDGQRCTTPDSCDGNGMCIGATVVCTPPAPMCVDASTSRSFTGGVCDPATGSCTFTAVDQSCTAGCDVTTGLCRNDPCIGIVCNQPPSQCYIASGTCSGGTCSYALKPTGAACDDGDPCTSTDACTAAGACIGTPLVCNQPPPPTCIDKKTTKSYQAIGACSNGSCTYSPIETVCANGCDSNTGMCRGDPCATVTCDTPPTQCHQSTGTCSDGKCSYELKPPGTHCDDGNVCTELDACDAAGNCVGQAKLCNAAPAATCVSADVSRTYAATGGCESSGECLYHSTDRDCDKGCDTTTGLCVGDPCGGVACTAPPSSCFMGTGQCSNGKCSYAPTPAGIVCDDGNACTEGEACDGNGNCVGGRTDPECGPTGSGGAATGGAAGASGSDLSGGSAAMAGAGGSSAGSAGRPSSALKPIIGPDDEVSCGCRTPQGGRTGAGWLAWLLSLFGIALARCRRH